MKKLLLALVFTPLFAFSQQGKLPLDPETKKITFEKVSPELKLAKDDILYRAKLFSVHEADNFYVTYNVDDREWAISRSKWSANRSNSKYTPFGYVEREEDAILGKAYFAYEKGHHGCMRFLTCSADVIMLAKDGQSKIRLTNFRYYNATIGSPPHEVSVREGDTRGPLEDFFAIEVCNKDFKKYFSWLNDNVNTLMDKYITYIQAENKLIKETPTKW